MYSFVIKKLLILLLYLINHLYCQDIDNNGYIVYCPCMGRFGNQAEQLLGTLQFAKSLNRTLVLPPFIQYNISKVNLVQFDDYIKVEPIQKYHRVILMEDFMKTIAPIVWPEESRKIFCYSSRYGQQTNDCNALDGNPFNAFWNNFGITRFKGGSIFHAPLTTNHQYKDEWIRKFKHEKVITFVGAPSSFPTNDDAVGIQQYINFSDKLANKAKEYRESRGFARTAYLSVHLRRGSDWLKACRLIKENSDIHELFSSKQCTSFYDSHDLLDYELCFPSFDTIIMQIKDIINLKQQPHKIRTVYIATDNDNATLWNQIHSSLPNITLIAPTITISSEGVITNHEPPTPLIDAYLMTYSNHFIGNCVSSFSAFVSRLRIFNLKFNSSTSFFAEHQLFKKQNLIKDEL